MARDIQPAGFVCVALVLLCALPVIGHTDCWTIETTGGESISTGDLWQIRNRITETSELIGEVNGSKTSVSLANVAQFTINQPGHRGTFDLQIHLLNEDTFSLGSDMDLYYLIEEEKKKKRVIRLADISAVNRCSDEAVTDSSVIPNVIGTAALETTSSSQASQVRAVLVTTSGDVLNGDLTDNQIMWQTNYGEITFRPEDIKLIVLQCGPDQTGLLETFSGDRLRGAIGDQPVAVRLSTGQTLSVPAKQIKFMDRSADNQEIAVHCNNEQD